MHVIESRFPPIVTRYLGPTDYKGSRISAVCGEYRVILSYDSALKQIDNHIVAAKKVFEKYSDYDYDITLYATDSLDSRGYLFVAIPMSE